MSITSDLMDNNLVIIGNNGSEGVCAFSAQIDPSIAPRLPEFDFLASKNNDTMYCP